MNFPRAFLAVISLGALSVTGMTAGALASDLPSRASPPMCRDGILVKANGKAVLDPQGNPAVCGDVAPAGFDPLVVGLIGAAVVGGGVAVVVATSHHGNNNTPLIPIAQPVSP